MTEYLIKRLVFMIITLFGITLVTFFLLKLAPGDPAISKLREIQLTQGVEVSQEVINQTLVLYGAKVEIPPWYQNFVDQAAQWVPGSQSSLLWAGKTAIQYTDWLKGILHFNFGFSTKYWRPVWDRIIEALPITLSLNLIEILIVYFISIPLGVYSAARRNSLFERSTMLLTFILYSLPSFWVATLLQKYFASLEHLNWFPVAGIMSEGAENLPFLQKLANIGWHLVLPVVTMVYGSFAYLSRFSRTTTLEVIKQDFIRTALAKGVKENKVLWRHAFRNALIPLITLIGALLPAMIGGSVIIETIFSIPGMGRLGFEAVLNRDYPTIMAIGFISAVLTLVGILLSDLAYVWADPRVSFNKREIER